MSAGADTRLFQLIVDGVSRMLGYAVVVVGMRDTEDALRVVAVAEGGRLGTLADGTPVQAASLIGNRWPVAEVTATLDAAEDWGRFRFSGRRRAGAGAQDWVGDAPITEDVSRWHPLSALRAPLHGDDGELIGLLSVDLPHSGRLPGTEQLALLARFAEHTRREILSARGRQRAAERARLLRTARDAVRRASADPTMVGGIDEATAAVFAGFGVVGLRLRVFDGEEPGFVRSLGQRYLTPSPELAGVSRLAAERLWQRGEVMVLGNRQVLHPVDTGAREQVLADLAANGMDSLLLVPLGSGATCWGALVLLRDAGAPLWTDAECAVALDIGRDIGPVLHRARIRERQRALIRELAALDAYHTSLITTVAAQLHGPLDAIEDSLPRIADPEHGIDGTAIATIARSAADMTGLVEDLLLLSRLAHPDDRPSLEVVDLRDVVRRVRATVGAETPDRDPVFGARLPATPAPVCADPAELARMLAELVENALRHTAAGGTVTVALERHGTDALLTVTDDGTGVAEEELPHVLTDFFRGAEARRAAPAGAGLGLSIVDRIVRRHRGTLTITSGTGSGTVVRVTLPVAEEPGA